MVAFRAPRSRSRVRLFATTEPLMPRGSAPAPVWKLSPAKKIPSRARVEVVLASTSVDTPSLAPSHMQSISRGQARFLQFLVVIEV